MQATLVNVARSHRPMWPATSPYVAGHVTLCGWPRRPMWAGHVALCGKMGQCGQQPMWPFSHGLFVLFVKCFRIESRFSVSPSQPKVVFSEFSLKTEKKSKNRLLLSKKKKTNPPNRVLFLPPPVEAKVPPLRKISDVFL